MKIFVDTSSLFKLYRREPGEEEVERLLMEAKINAIFLSDITKLEFVSAIRKKVRNRDISEQTAYQLIDIFKADFHKFTFVVMDEMVIDEAQVLLTKYGKIGLRSLDSIQLATAVLMKEHTEFNSTSDKLIKRFFKKKDCQINSHQSIIKIELTSKCIV